MNSYDNQTIGKSVIELCLEKLNIVTTSSMIYLILF